MDTLDLSEFFKTKAEAQQFSEQISAVTDKIYNNGFDLNAALTEHFGVEKKDRIITLMRDNSISVESKSSLKEFFTKVIDRCNNLLTLSITLAFEPSQDTLNILSEWCLVNLGKQVVFEVKSDYSLIGGATIFYNGKYFTFSIKQNFDKAAGEILPSAKTDEAQNNNQIPEPNSSPSPVQPSQTAQ